MRAPALLKGKGDFVPGRQPLLSPAAHHPALGPFDMWLGLLLGLLGTEPAPFSLTMEVEHSVCVCVCVCVWLSEGGGAGCYMFVTGSECMGVSEETVGV